MDGAEQLFAPKVHTLPGPSTNTGFDKGVLNHPDYPFMSFLGYTNYSNRVLDSNFDAKTNRDGVILAEKDTKFFNTVVEASFENDTDTCLIGYSSTIKQIHIGRSALVSLFNFASVVSGNGKNNTQEPYDYAEMGMLEGKIQLQQHYCSFFFEKNTKTKTRPSWLLINHDTLRFGVVKQAVKNNGKIKKCKWGIQLQHGTTIYGAVSFFPPDKEIYISRQLNKQDRILVGAYLSILAYYN